MLHQKQAYLQIRRAKMDCFRTQQTQETAFSLVLSLQSFLVSVEQCESWISNKEAFLSNQNLGVSPGPEDPLMWRSSDKHIGVQTELGDRGGGSAEETGSV